MPALPPVANTLKIKIGWTIGSDINAVTILHARYSGGPPSATDAVNLATSIHGFVAARFRPLVGVHNDLASVEVTDLSSSSGAQGIFNTTLAGTRAGGDLGAATAALTSWIILRRYRGGKPRSYWPFGVTTDLTSPTQWTGAFTTAMQTAVQLFYNDMLTATSGTTAITALVNVSYYSGFTAVQNVITGRWRNVPKVRTGAIPTDILVSFTSPTKLASQRRRNLQRP